MFLWEGKYANHQIQDGIATFEIDVREEKEEVKTASLIGIDIPEFEKEELREIFVYPHAMNSQFAEKAIEVDWKGVKNKPKVSDLEGEVLLKQIPQISLEKIDGLSEKMGEVKFKNKVSGEKEEVSLIIKYDTEK